MIFTEFKNNLIYKEIDTGETISKGNLVSINSTTGKIRKGIVSGSSILGIAQQNGVADDFIYIAVEGTAEGLSSLVAGEPCFSNSTGNIYPESTANANSATFFVGIAINATELRINITTNLKELQDPVGTIKEIYPFYPSWVSLPPEYAWMEGQIISDIDSPLNGFRVPNANGGTVTGVAITALDNTLKTITVSTNDIWAFGVGDTLTFTGASVTNAVVRSINYSTGVIKVGDVTLWSIGLGLFGLTTGTLTGATAVSSVGVPRYPKGGLAAGSGIDTFQGHRHTPRSPNSRFIDIFVGSQLGIGNNFTVSEVYTTGDPTTDTFNGTPRTAQRTEPPSLNVRLAIKIK